MEILSHSNFKKTLLQLRFMEFIYIWYGKNNLLFCDSSDNNISVMLKLDVPPEEQVFRSLFIVFLKVFCLRKCRHTGQMEMKWSHIHLELKSHWAMLAWAYLYVINVSWKADILLRACEYCAVHVAEWHIVIVTDINVKIFPVSGPLTGHHL